MLSLFDSRNPADPFNPFGGMQGAANLSGSLFGIVFILVNSVLASLAAILGGPLLFAFTKLFDWDTDLRLGRAWLISFIVYFGYFAVATLLGIDAKRPPAVDSFLDPDMIAHIVVRQTPPVLVASAILLAYLPAYRSVFGFVRAVAFVCFSLMISAAMMYLVTLRFASPPEVGLSAGEGFAMIGLITAVIVIPGCIVASPVIWLGAKLGPAIDKPLRFRTVLWTTILVLLAWIASVVAFECVFLTSEAMFRWYQAYSAAADPQQYAIANGLELRVSIIVAAGILLIALLIAGSVLTSRLSAAFPGRIGWLRAVLTTGVAVVVSIAPIAGLLGWAYAVGGFDDMAMYW